MLRFSYVSYCGMNSLQMCKISYKILDYDFIMKAFSTAQSNRSFNKIKCIFIINQCQSMDGFQHIFCCGGFLRRTATRKCRFRFWDDISSGMIQSRPVASRTPISATEGLSVNNQWACSIATWLKLM